MRNIELKARLDGLQHAAEVAASLATHALGTQRQVDTYFHVPCGRLKLRQIDGRAAQLVWYQRASEPGAKASDYQLVPIAHPETLKQALSAALGVRAVVDKRRTIYLYENVRIHLDEVVGLGTFLEFEAVLESVDDEARGYDQIAHLSARFGLSDADRVAASYGELILDRPGAA